MNQFKILGLICLSPSLVFSNTLLQNLSGDVGVEYKSHSLSDKGGTKKTSSLSEILELNYRDYIYSSKLLQYMLHVKFSQIDSSSEETQSLHEETEYNLRTNIIKDSRFPLSLTFLQSFTPTTSLNSTTGIQETTFATNEAKLNGFINFPTIQMNYGYFDSQRKAENISGVRDTSQEDINYSITKKFNDYSLNMQLIQNISNDEINYDNLNKKNDEIQKIITNFNTNNFNFLANYTTRVVDNDVDLSSNEEVEEIGTSFNWRILENFAIDNNFLNIEDKFNDSTNITENLNLDWEVTKKLNTYFSLFYNEYIDSENFYKNIGLNFNSQYKISPLFLTNQTLTYYTAENKSNSTEDIAIGFNGSYERPIAKMSSLKLLGSLTANSASSDIEEDNGQSYTIDVTAGIENRFKNSTSVLNYDINYAQTLSTYSTEEKKLKLSSSFTTHFIHKVDFNMNADYSIRDTSSKKNKDDASKEKVLNFFTGFIIQKNIDVRGRLSANLGLKYNKQDREEESIKSFTPNLNGTFTYRLWRDMVYNAEANIFQDSLNDITNYMIKSRLDYKFRQFNINLTTDYNKQVGDEKNNVTSSNIMLKLTRKF